MPRFSIIIPTRNRDIVFDSIQSVIDQDFNDFELIISDNSTDEQSKRLRHKLEAYARDKRVRYIRPARELSMTDHWEWAMSHARGEFVSILTDRMVYRSYTLRTVDRIIEQSGAKLLCYDVSTARENEKGVWVPFPPAAIKQQWVDTQATLDQFASTKLTERTPRFLNTFVSLEELNNIKSAYGSIFTGIAPDYGFMFRSLDHFDRYLFVYFPFIVKQRDDISNGKSVTRNRNNEYSNDFISRMYQEQNHWLSFGPIPNEPFIANNIILREYDIAKKYSQRKAFKDIDKQTFYNRTSVEIRNIMRVGADISYQADKIEEFRLTNGLRRHYGYKQQFKNARRQLKDTARRLFPSFKKQSDQTNVPRYPDIISAIRADNYEPNIAQVVR